MGQPLMMRQKQSEERQIEGGIKENKTGWGGAAIWQNADIMRRERDGKRKWSAHSTKSCHIQSVAYHSKEMIDSTFKIKPHQFTYQNMKQLAGANYHQQVSDSANGFVLLNLFIINSYPL